MNHTVLTLDAGHPGQMEAMKAHFEVLRPRKPDPERFIIENREQIQAITSFLTPVSRALIEALPNLEIVALGAVGTDHVDTEALKSRGIRLTNTPDVLSQDTADMAVFLMLGVMRRAVEGDAFVRAGLWRSGPLALGASLGGKRAGIVGLGRIGQEVARRCLAFGMSVSYTGPRQKPEHAYPYYPDVFTLAQACDVLILTCAGGPATQGLVDHRVLAALGPKGYVINIARGSVIAEQDLLEALSSRTIAGAGLDVFALEPAVPEALMRMDNVALTPHIGSATVETRTKMGHIVVENLRAHFEGRPLLTPVSL